MPPPTSYTQPLTSSQAKALEDLLRSQGWEFTPRPYCLFTATRGKVGVQVYEKGPKVLVQGKDTADFIVHVLEPQILGKAEFGYEEVLNPEMFQPHIGVDESGKGDLFGPLVIAGVYVDGSTARALQQLGVMDSKRIGSDQRIEQLARAIRSVPGLVFEIVQINPGKYNELYAKFGNLNRLLAWGHAKVIEVLLERVPDCPRALSDQFANPAVLQRALQTKGRSIELIQRTKAESDLAVAAASILARERFVRWLNETGKDLTGTAFPKGVSPLVKEAAKRLLQNKDDSFLAEVAKMHFKTADEILKKPAPPINPSTSSLMD